MWGRNNILRLGGETFGEWLPPNYTYVQSTGTICFTDDRERCFEAALDDEI